MLQPLSWPWGSSTSRRYAGAITWAPMSPPVGVLFVNTRSRWTTWRTANVAPPTTTRAVRYWTIRSVGHGEFSQRLGRRMIRRPMRVSSGGLSLVGSLSGGSTSIGRSSTTVTGAILPSTTSATSSPAGHEDQPGGVERHVRQHAHPQPAGAQGAGAEHQAEQEQAGVLDRAEVDDGEPRGDDDHADDVVQPTGERPLQQPAIHQLLDDRGADDDDEDEDDVPATVRRIGEVAGALLDAVAPERVRPPLLQRPVQQAQQDELGEHADGDADQVDRLEAQAEVGDDRPAA